VSRGAAAAAALAAALLASPGTARAQTESPREGSFEIGAGPFRPDVDSEFTSNPGPYQATFGDTRRWALRVGYARLLYTGNYGTLEAGFRSGFFRASGHGFVLDATGAPTTTKSRDPTTFNIVPTSLTLGYRFDRFLEKWWIPLAPYGKVALERYNWWVTEGSGKTSEKGATNGWSLTGGVAFLLDIIDPQLAREMDQDSGINDTYIYADVTRAHVNDFGSSKSWDLSQKSLQYSFGLLFVF
jgi:hypothetical protein